MLLSWLCFVGSVGCDMHLFDFKKSCSDCDECGARTAGCRDLSSPPKMLSVRFYHDMFDLRRTYLRSKSSRRLPWRDSGTRPSIGWNCKVSAKTSRRWETDWLDPIGGGQHAPWVLFLWLPHISMNILRVCVISITVISHIHTHYIQPCVCIKYVSICTQHFYLFLHISCVTVTVTLQRFQPLSSRRARSSLKRWMPYCVSEQTVRRRRWAQWLVIQEENFYHLVVTVMTFTVCHRKSQPIY